MAEEARLESVYTPKGYPEFESRSLRKIDTMKINELRSNFLVSFLVYRPMNSLKKSLRCRKLTEFAEVYWLVKVNFLLCPRVLEICKMF